MRPLRWGIIGAGAIARDFSTALLGTAALSGTDAHRITHVAAPRLESAARLAQSLGARASTSLETLLDDPEVDALYVASPHPFHEEAALAAIARGKPVLIEKPLCPGVEATERVLAAARSAGVLAREGYMYRCHPLLERVAELVRTQLGHVRLVRADFGFGSVFDPTHRKYRPEWFGGGIWDVGGYPVTLAQWVAGLNLGRNFAPAEQAHFAGRTGPTGVDVLALAQLEFPGGLLAELGCSIELPLGTRALLYGEGGTLELENPWLPSGDRQGTESHFVLRLRGRDAQRHTVTAPPIFALEADSFRNEWLGLPGAPHAVGQEESSATCRLLESWRQALG